MIQIESIHLKILKYFKSLLLTQLSAKNSVTRIFYGVADPYPWGMGFYEQRQNAIQHERVEEAILLAIAAKDYQALGEIVFDQSTEYARSQIENRS